MKNRWLNIGFFLFGAGIFVYLVSQFGLDLIGENIVRAGWSLLFIVLVWLVIYLLGTLAWKLLLDDDGGTISFLHLFMVNVSGAAINTITPVLALGGEPYKVKSLADKMGTSQSFSAVVAYRMVYMLGHMLMLLAGIIAALFWLSLPTSLVLVLIPAGAIMLLIVVVMFSGLRDGVFHRLQKFLRSIRLFRRLSERLQAREQSLFEMDDAVTHAYRNQRKKFYSAIMLEFLCRACMGIEVWLILRGAGVETSLVSALFIYVAYSIIINILFFIPLNLGVREGGLSLGLQSLALPAMLGIYLGVVIRIREFVWILLGLLLILPLTRKSMKPIVSQGNAGGKTFR